MKLMISEVLRKAHNAKTKAAKIKILQDNSTQTLRSMFIMNFVFHSKFGFLSSWTKKKSKVERSFKRRICHQMDQFRSLLRHQNCHPCRKKLNFDQNQMNPVPDPVELHVDLPVELRLEE